MTESKAALDIHEILKILPHRYPLLLIDRVLELKRRERIVAIKNVTINEPFFNGIERARFRRPVSPGDQLRLEVQVTGWRPSARMIAAKMYGQALVNGKRVAEATVSCQLIDSSRGRGGEDQATE